jgi:hypothetical protein
LIAYSAIPAVAATPSRLGREGSLSILTGFLYFPATFHIEFLCATALRMAMVLGSLVMTLANLENGRTRLRAALNFKPRQEIAAPTERASDVWPDWSTELAEAELTKAAEKNRPSVVLWEAARAIMISVGMVVLLMVGLSILHVR